MTSINAESHKDPAQLEREVDQSRAHMSETLSALEEKLSPSHLVDQVLTYARENSGEFSQNLVDAVKRNPVPTLLTAVGLGWLIYGQQHPRQLSTQYTTTGYRDTSTTVGSSHTSLTERGKQMQDHLGKSATDMKTQLDQGADHLKHQAQHAADSLRHQGERAKVGFTHMLEQQPLALGALGIALGALIGGALPPTRQEDKLLGKTRDHLVDQGRAKAKDLYDKTRNQAQEFSQDVTEDPHRNFHQQSPQSPYGPQ